ncbi:MAG: hypothetical protein IJK60_00425 [Clostridia bacterium]|nr:hypothetical protein [Clostridia bacterium]
MKRFRTAALAFILIALVILPSCSMPFSADKARQTTLKIGVENIKGGFNPFFDGEDIDSVIMTQMFETVQRQGNENRFENLCGSITYEFLEGDRVKYTVSLDDDVMFSDGTYATIDDVIFYYYVLADASYDGRFSDWYLNDIQGLKAFYYDDKNYEEKLSEIDEQSESKSERDKKTKEYIKKNYSDGISVSEISGIKKISNRACTITFNSVNINAISQINPLIVSKAAYGAGYVKGKAEIIKENAETPIGSGPYKFKSFNKNSGFLTMTANERYHGETPGFDSLRFIDLTAKKLDGIKAVVNGTVDICETTANTEKMNAVSSSGLRFGVTDSPFYTSIIFNCKNIDENMRKGIMSLANWTGEAKTDYDGCFTALYRPLSARFGEYPPDVTEPFYPVDGKKAEEFFKEAGCKKTGEKLLDFEGNAVSYKMLCLSDGKDVLAKVANSFITSLKSVGVELKVDFVDEEEYLKSQKKHSADMWCGPVYDNTTCDKYEYYHTGGSLNYSLVSDLVLDLLLEETRKCTDYSERCSQTASMLKVVMSTAAELPLYQLKTITVYNTQVIDENSIPLDADLQGCRYIIPELRPVEK